MIEEKRFDSDLEEVHEAIQPANVRQLVRDHRFDLLLVHAGQRSHWQQNYWPEPSKNRRGIQAVIPTRKDQRRLPGFEKATYRRRNVVERCIGWLKESRRLATRFEKLAENFLAMVKLAMLERLLKTLLPVTA